MSDRTGRCLRCGSLTERATSRGAPSIGSRVALAGIRFYQNYISPLKMGSTCRFEPTCSAYALHVVRTRGAVIGIMLTLVRLSKCGPWHPGGYDPAPKPRRPRSHIGCPYCTPTTTKES